MLQRDRLIRTQIHQLADASLFAISFWLAYFLREWPAFSNAFGLVVIPPDAFDQSVWLYFLLVPAAPLVLESQGFYNRPVASRRGAMFWPLLRSCLIVTVGLVLLVFLFRRAEFAPRGVMVLFGILSFTLVWAKEELVLLGLRSQLARAQYQRRIILAGIPSETARLRRDIAGHAGEGVVVAAEFNLAGAPLHELIELLHEHSVSGVFVTARHAEFERVESVIRLCEIEGVEAWLVADFFATQIARASFDEMFGHPLLVFRTTPEASWQIIAKLLLDFFGALALILVTAIPMLLIALWIKLTSPGPAIFRQQRSGQNGAPFTIFKFRTMTTNAEQFKHELAAMNEMSGPVFKVTNDPRITRFGKWLRQWSLDELPQLFNVLRGEMSLVGPRPLPVDEVRRFSDLAHRRRLSVKPGLTCLWQIKGRNQISDFKEWVRLDLEYIDNWSFWLDLKILLLTPPAVLRGTGAKYKRAAKPPRHQGRKGKAEKEKAKSRNWKAKRGRPSQNIGNNRNGCRVEPAAQSIEVQPRTYIDCVRATIRPLLRLKRGRRFISCRFGQFDDATPQQFNDLKKNQPTSVVTGAAGFLGSHLTDLLLARGHKVIGIDNFVTGSVDNIAHLGGNPQFKFIQQDVSEFIFLDAPVDYVWHFASPASPIDYLKIPIQTMKVGSLGTHKALGLAKNKGARFLVASTSEIYGDPHVHPQPEEYWGNVNTIGPRGCYDEAKRFAEAMTMAYHREHKVETRIVRIFNTYGPRMRLHDGRVVPAFISQALKNKPVTIFGKGTQTRSFCYVSDLIEGIYRLMMSDYDLPVNIGNPAEMTMLQFAEQIIKATGSRSKLVFKPLPQDDPKQRKPDITKAKKLLKWEPRVNLADGLTDTIAYFRWRV